MPSPNSRLGDFASSLSTLARQGSARLPLLPLAAGLWFGCGFSQRQSVGLAGAALFVLLEALPERWPTRPAAQVALGVSLGWVIAVHPSPSVCPEPDNGKTTEWIGRVVSLGPAREARTSVVIDLLSGRRADAESPLHCRALVSAGRRFPEVIEGDVVWLPAVDLEPPAHLVNPGAGDSAAALTDRGIERVGSLPDGAGILTLEHNAPPRRILARLRAAAEERMRTLAEGDAREVVRALGIGERGALSVALEEALRDSGLRHLLSLGLLYVSLWAALIALPFAAAWSRIERLALGLPARRAAALATLPVCVVYGLLGDGPTAGRAMIVGSTVALASALGRRAAHPLHLFCLGLMALLAVAPDEASRPALLWSLAALGGISILAGPVLARSAWSRQGNGRTGVWVRVRAELVRVIVIGAAAFAATAPLQLASGSRLPWIGIVLTPVGLLFSVPAALLAQAGALSANAALLRLALWPAADLARLALLAARAGVPHLPLPAAAALGAGALALLASAALVRGRSRVGLALLPLAAATLLIPPAYAALHRAAVPRLRLTFLSVGHGDSMLMETPHGRALLIDGGGSVVGGFDPGREILVPFLEARGIRELAAVVLTHPHPDHANGLPAVLRSFAVGEVWESGEPCPLPACEELADLERRRGIRHVELGTGRFVRDLDGVDLVLRSPRLPSGYDPALGPNDNSLVFDLSYGRFRALLTGDIEATAEERLLAQGADLGAFLLKAPHHGSDTSSTEGFVGAVHPAVVIFSVGPRNRFDFPRPVVCDRYRRIGAQAYRTDRDGAVTIETDGQRAWVTSTTGVTAPFEADLTSGRKAGAGLP